MAKQLNGLAITNKGIEDVCAGEITELIHAKKTEARETAVTFGFKDYSELCTLAYRMQSAHRVILLLGTCKAGSTLEETKDSIAVAIAGIDLKEFLNDKTPFKVEARREGEHAFNSVDAATETAQLIMKALRERYGFTPVVSMDAPDIIFYLYIYNEDIYLGVDFCGIDISKRDYKIFSHPESLKATLAYSLVRLSGLKNKQILLDPFCGSGIIPIEAAIYKSRIPVNYYRKNKLIFTRYKFTGVDTDAFFKKNDSSADEEKISIFGSDIQLRHMSSSQKNGKIAGVSKFVRFSRIDIEWIDTKFEDGSIDTIVTDPPQDSKAKSTRELEKLYNEFLHQAGFVLKKKGRIVLLVRTPGLMAEACKKQKFIIDSKREIYSGKQKFDVYCLKRDG